MMRPTEPKNLLIIMSDEHNRSVAGHAGHAVVTTPHLDDLAARGTRFTAAYTPSPICVPARASFATGQPVHRTRCWDNAIAYDGRLPSWHHALRARGHHVAAIGKLHYRGHATEDYGLSESILPMHITGGTGDVTMLIRDPDDVRELAARKLIADAGPGESSYTLYDRQVAAAAQIWLRETAPRLRQGKPWVLFVSMVAPHFPLTAPPEHYYRYAGRDLPRPKLATPEERPDHLYVRTYARRSDHWRHFRDSADLNRALAGYFGLVSFMDEHVGRILAALRDAGLEAETRVAYTSDHGDNLGARGLWGKATMYEESAGIPLILSGAEVPAGATCATPVTLCDLAATVLDAVGAPDAIADLELPGTSLLGLAAAPAQDRVAFSEFHTYGPDGFYMLRTLRHKYVYYIGAPPQLFDLQADPEELRDLGQDPAHTETRRAFEARLRAMLDPEAVDAQAKADQAAMIARHGGEAAVRGRERMAYTPPPAAWAG
jgi:choline-sulfatase